MYIGFSIFFNLNFCFLVNLKLITNSIALLLSQMSYSLVMMLELNDVSEVQYKKIMIIGDK